MVFGESCYYTLAAPLTIGQNYTITVSVSTGQLGANTIISGNHTFNIVGLTSPPSNCGGANYGSACSTPGATLLLSGTVNTIGWQTFTNTFTATSALRYIVLGNCDGTGNGGNLFCNMTLTNSIVFPAVMESFSAQSNGCEVETNWTISETGSDIEVFELVKAAEGKSEEIVARIAPQSNRQEYSYTDDTPALNGDYQVRILYKDGGISLSEVVHVQSDCDDMSAAIEGNPVHGNEAILRYSTDGSPMMISIYDVEGKKVAEQTLPANEAGRHRAKLDISSLRPGIYFIRTPDGQVAKLQRM